MATPTVLWASLVFTIGWTLTSARFIYNETEECPYVTGMRNFSIHRHLGQWQVVEHLDTPFMYGLSCVYFEFVNQKHREFLVKLVGFREINNDTVRLWRNEEIITTYTCFFNHSDPAVMTILHTNETALEYLPTYVVVDTDYVNYSILYSCFQPLFGEKKIEFLWILERRDRQLPARKIQKVLWRLHRLGVNTTALIQSYEYNCQTYNYNWFW